IILTIFGLLISYLTYDGGLYYESIISVNYFIGFSVMALIGILFLLFAVLLFLRRAMSYLWNRIGNSVWKNSKNYFTLALKHLSVYIKDYKNTIMVFFLIGLCVTPGLIIAKSLDLHTTLETNLSVGCSDILVENWNIDENLESNISKIDGVELSTVLSNIQLDMKDSSVLVDSHYIINFYVITNITEYVEIVNFTLLTQDGYSKNDITMLETNLTYLMNRKYARKNDYNNDEIFSTVGISTSSLRPKELVYINDFSYFPLIPRRKFEKGMFYDLFHQPTYIDLVVSNKTKDIILEYTEHDRIQKDYLLIKTVEGANITAIKEELSSKYHLTAYTVEDSLTTMDSTLNILGLKLFVLITILSILLTAIYGCFKAANIYKERKRLLEIFIRNGARNWVIVGNFSLEFVLVLFIPIIVSIVIAIPYLKILSGFMLNVVTEYSDFTLWYPWWIFILTGLIALFSVLIGWCVCLSLFVKSYKSYKNE
ncbi:MAG: ABC transporter permease, partial [Candidatus Heimdallarchaeota archaeon]